MRRLAYPTLPLAIALLAAAACNSGDGDDVADSGNEPVDPTETGGETEGDTEGATETEGDTETGGEPADPFAACRELPAGSAWVEGESIASTAESTDARIEAAGAQTWPLALRLLQVVDSASTPSVAASPASMYAAMGLAYGRWQEVPCGERIAEVMAFPEIGNDIHATLGASIRALEARALPAEDDVDPVAISLRQSTWLFDATAVPEQTPLVEAYGAVQNALSERGPAARELINCVIEVQSQGLLPDFLPEGQPAADTSSYDINVAFLQAPWAAELGETTLQFHAEDGSTAQVDGFGSYLTDAQLYEGESFTSVELGLRGGEIAMMVVLPTNDDGGLAAFADSLTADALATARDQAHTTLIDFSMPKVDIASTTLDYNDGRLDFQCEPFTLRAVFHGAAVQIDHKGIKAAAATVAEGWSDGEPSPETTIVVDRPFLFFVYDRATSFVLYSGRWAG
jgi:serpin B